MASVTITIEDTAGGGVRIRTEGCFGPDQTAAQKLGGNLAIAADQISCLGGPREWTKGMGFVQPLGKLDASDPFAEFRAAAAAKEVTERELLLAENRTLKLSLAYKEKTVEALTASNNRLADVVLLREPVESGRKHEYHDEAGDEEKSE